MSIRLSVLSHIIIAMSFVFTVIRADQAEIIGLYTWCRVVSMVVGMVFQQT